MVEILFAFGERRDDPWRDARADECTLTPDPGSETEELDDDRIPRPVELVDRGHLEHDASSVAEPSRVHHDVDRRRHLRPDMGDGEVDVGHQGHRLEAPERVTRRVRVRGRERTIVSRVHRLEHVEGLTAADLTDDDPIRSHPERVANQISDRDLAATLDGRRSGLKTDHVGLRES